MILMDYSDFRLIPMIPLVKRGILHQSNRLAAVTVMWDSGEGMVTQAPEHDYQNYVKWLKGQQDKGIPWMMMDAGRSKSGPDYSLMKDSRVRGWQRWFDPGIRTIDDVFDAFSMDVDMLMIGSSNLDSFEVFEEAHEVSDSCIPLLMYNGKSVIFSNGVYDLSKTLKKIDAIGFENIVVLDLPSLGRNNKPGNPFWRDIYRGRANLIPAGGITEKDLPYLREWDYNQALRDYLNPPVQLFEENPLPEINPSSTKYGLKRSVSNPSLDF